MAEEKQQEKIKNNVKIEEVGPCKKKVVIEIPEEAVKAATDEQYGELGRDSVVPGFRKGRAPRRLLEKRFGKEVCQQIKLKLLSEASEDALKDCEFDSLGEPDVDFENIELPDEGALKFEFEIEVRPDIELPKLEGIAVEKPALEVTDKQVGDEIEQIQKRMGLWTPQKDGKIELEDQIIADVMIIDEEGKETKLDNNQITVRQSGIVGPIPVEKLGEILVGSKVGDKKKASVEVPKTFYNEEYRGKKFEIKIDIEDIKRLKPAALDKELFEKLAVEDEKQLKERVREMFESRMEQQQRMAMGQQIYKYLEDKVKIDLPADLVADQAKRMLMRQKVNLMYQGLDKAAIEEQAEQLEANSEVQARQEVKQFFIMDTLAAKLDLTVTEEEINGQIAQMAIQRGQRPEQMRETMAKDGSLTQMGVQIRDDKCIGKLLESAKITDAKPAAKKTSVKKTTKKPAAKKSGSADKPKTAKKATAKKKTAKTTKKTTKKKDSGSKK